MIAAATRPTTVKTPPTAPELSKKPLLLGEPVPFNKPVAKEVEVESWPLGAVIVVMNVEVGVADWVSVDEVTASLDVLVGVEELEMEDLWGSADDELSERVVGDEDDEASEGVCEDDDADDAVADDDARSEDDVAEDENGEVDDDEEEGEDVLSVAVLEEAGSLDIKEQAAAGAKCMRHLVERRPYKVKDGPNSAETMKSLPIAPGAI